MVSIRFFASIREVTGCRIAEFSGSSVGEILDASIERYGQEYAALLQTCTIWCNGEVANVDQNVGQDDELAVLPPVSGG